MAWGFSGVRAGRARNATRFDRTSTLALVAGAAALACQVSAAKAQDTDEDAPADMSPPAAGEATFLDRITVVSRTGETPIETMGSVSQVAGEDLERHMATTPRDIFFGVPGVTIQADNQRSVSGVNIRGLQDFGRVAVIVDGARQNFQRSDHGTQSMVFIDPELIDQVDVIRGPVANTYGSGAIGGVASFETKDAGDFLEPDETWAASLRSQFETNGEGWTKSAVGAYRFNDMADIIANVVWRDYGSYEDGDGDTAPGTGFDVLSGLVKATVRPTDTSELKLGWIGTGEEWTDSGNDQEFDLDQNTFTARYNVTDPDRTWLDLNINTSLNLTNLDQTYLNDVQRVDPSGAPVTLPAGSRTNYDLETYGLDVWNTSRFSTGALHHELTYGGDWVMDDVVTASPNGGSDFFTPSGEREIWGGYIEDKISYDDWLEVVGGLRYDSYSLEGDGADNSGDRLSPRITVGVSPFDDDTWDGLQFYGTYAEGYRSPSVSETLISGLHPTPGAVFPFLPNPDLQPETAKTWEAGINYGVDGVFQPADSLRLKAAYFHNDIDDYIEGVTLSPFDPTSGCPFLPSGTIPICFQYQNVAEARIDGVELEATYDAGRYFARLSASFIDGHTIARDGTRADLATVPSSQVTGRLGFRFLEERLTVGGEVQYNEAPDGAIVADDHTLVNLFASYKASENARFDLRVDNLFDVKYANPLNASATTPVYEPGLSVKLAARVRFGG